MLQPNSQQVGARVLSKRTLVLLTLFLGGAGVHRVYLGRVRQGILFLLFSLTFIPVCAACVDLFYYVRTDEGTLRREWPNVCSRRTLIGFCLAVGAYMCLIWVLVWAYLTANPYATGYRMSNGFNESAVAVAMLAEKITADFMASGATDMSCDSPERGGCRFAKNDKCGIRQCFFETEQTRDAFRMGMIATYPGATVMGSIKSDSKGAITVSLSQEFLGWYWKRSGKDVSIVPTVDGVEVDLSDSANSGRTPIIWRCAKDSRTTLALTLVDKLCSSSMLGVYFKKIKELSISE